MLHRYREFDTINRSFVVWSILKGRYIFRRLEAVHNFSFNFSFKGMSHNQAIKNVSKLPPRNENKITLIDFDSIIRNIRAYTLLFMGRDILFDDGIHLNVYGQMVWSCEFLAQLGLVSRDVTLNELTKLAKENWTRIGFYFYRSIPFLLSPSQSAGLFLHS